MDLGPPLLSVCVMMVCLLGASRSSNDDKIITCSCLQIPLWNRTEPPPYTCNHKAFRYKCKNGYVRKVGTSNLIRCLQENNVSRWSSPSLQCIPDPNPTTTLSPTTVTKGHTDIPHDPIFTTTVTAASTSPQMTLSITPPASVTAQTDSAEPTSAGPHVPSYHTPVLWETKETSTSTSTSSTTEPSDNSTVKPHVSGPNLGNTMTAVIALASVVITCALIGVFFSCYRRRSKSNFPPHTEEEQIPMHDGPEAQA